MKIGTVFEHLRIPLHKALQTAYLLCASKKGISSIQLSRTLQISLKTAWFLSHRVREAMKPNGELAMMCAAGGFVEADETYIGCKQEGARRRPQDGGYVACRGWRRGALIPYHAIRWQDTFRRFGSEYVTRGASAD
jgi:hypothetical protein